MSDPICDILVALRHDDADVALLDALEIAARDWFNKMPGCSVMAFNEVTGSWVGELPLVVEPPFTQQWRNYSSLVFEQIYPDRVHAMIILILGLLHMDFPSQQRYIISLPTAITLRRLKKLLVDSRCWSYLRLPIAQALLELDITESAYQVVPHPKESLLTKSPFVNGTRDEQKAFIAMIASTVYVGHFIVYVQKYVSAAPLDVEWTEFVFDLMVKHVMSQRAPVSQIRRSLGLRYANVVKKNWPHFYRWINPIYPILANNLPPLAEIVELGELKIQTTHKDTTYVAAYKMTHVVANPELWRKCIAAQQARYYFALMVLVSDEYLAVARVQPDHRESTWREMAKVERFFRIATRLPTDVQQVLAQRTAGRNGTTLAAIDDVILQWALDA